MLLLDHGVFRLIMRNRHEIAPGMARSNQPAPHNIRREALRGIRTIINLRGASDHGHHHLERDACAEAGIELIDFLVRSREMPAAETVFAAHELFRTIEYPAVMHCKSGADRVGLMSALYLHLHEGRPIEEALRQLHLRYGHVRLAKTGVLDFFLETYRDHHRATGESMLDWLKTGYDREALQRSYHSNRWANILVDRILMRE